MKIKKQTRKLAAGCSKHCFEVIDKTDEVSSKHGFEVVDETDEVSNHTYGKVKLTWFEEIFEEYHTKSPVPQDEEQGFLSINYSSVPRQFLATSAARTPPTIGARMKIQTC